MLTDWQRLKKQIVGITITPLLARLERLHDRMLSCVIMLRCMPVRRAIAASYVTTDLAQPKVQPPCADLQAILTTVGARRDRDDLGQVCASLHRVLFILRPLPSPDKLKTEN